MWFKTVLQIISLHRFSCKIIMTFFFLYLKFKINLNQSTNFSFSFYDFCFIAIAASDTRRKNCLILERKRGLKRLKILYPQLSCKLWPNFYRLISSFYRYWRIKEFVAYPWGVRQFYCFLYNRLYVLNLMSPIYLRKIVKLNENFKIYISSEQFN